MRARDAIIYVRMSSDRAGGGLGIARQESDCRALAERLGWDVIGVEADNDISAASGRPRPGYQRLLQRLEDGQADGLLAWHADRIHRSPAELEHFIDVVERAGVQVATVQAGNLDLSSPTGRMVARMLGASARYEIDHMVERQQARRRQKVSAGEWPGGRRPFGYEPDGRTVREDEAAVVRQVAERVLSGASLSQVARELNDRGVATSTGKQWRASELRRMLLRPRNAGLMQHRGEIVGQASWEPLLDEDTWRGVQALLTDPNRRTSPGGWRKRIGGGLYLCGLCGQPVRSSQMKGRVFYACDPSKHVARNAAAVDELVGDVIVDRMSRPDAAELLAPAGEDLGGLHQEQQALRARLDEAARLYAEGAVDGQQLARMSEGLRGRLDEVESRLASAAAGSPLAGFADAPPREAWESMDVDVQHDVARVLVEVTLLPARKGRPPGWRPGQPYFDPSSVDVRLKV